MGTGADGGRLIVPRAPCDRALELRAVHSGRQLTNRREAFDEGVSTNAERRGRALRPLLGSAWELLRLGSQSLGRKCRTLAP